jgi:hypothetical protein
LIGQWKSIDEARETDEENEQARRIARRKSEMQRNAPPLTDVVEPRKTAEERAAFAERAMREAGLRA